MWRQQSGVACKNGRHGAAWGDRVGEAMDQMACALAKRHRLPGAQTSLLLPTSWAWQQRRAAARPRSGERSVANAVFHAFAAPRLAASRMNSFSGANETISIPKCEDGIALCWRHLRL